jgi:hypothetical protein
MSIQVNQIELDAYYLAGKSCRQIRKVTKIQIDEKGRKRIIYVAKSIKKNNLRFSSQGTLSNPALEETFAKSCCKKLTDQEVDALRRSGVLLSDE